MSRERTDKSVEQAVIDFIDKIYPLVKEDPTQAQNELQRARNTLEKLKYEYEHGKLRNRGYAELLLTYLPQFVCPIIIRLDNEIHNGSGCLVELDE